MGSGNYSVWVTVMTLCRVTWVSHIVYGIKPHPPDNWQIKPWRGQCNWSQKWSGIWVSKWFTHKVAGGGGIGGNNPLPLQMLKIYYIKKLPNFFILLPRTLLRRLTAQRFRGRSAPSKTNSWLRRPWIYTVPKCHKKISWGGVYIICCAAKCQTAVQHALYTCTINSQITCLQYRSLYSDVWHLHSTVSLKSRSQSETETMVRVQSDTPRLLKPHHRYDKT